MTQVAGVDILSFPYQQFLMLRPEYMQITGDDIEAYMLRLVESLIKQEKSYKDWEKQAEECTKQGTDVPAKPCVYVSLSYRQVLMWLYGIVKNEKTIIAKFKSLLAKEFLLRRCDPINMYASPQYTLNIDKLEDALKKLPTMTDFFKALVPDKKGVPVATTPPTNGTPDTSSYHSPVPPTGTGTPQQVVPSNNSLNNLGNNTNLDRENRANTLSEDAIASQTPSLSFSEMLSEQNTPTTKVPIADEPAQDAPSQQQEKRTRTPREPKEPDITQAQIDRVFATMDEALRSPAIYNDPEFSMVQSHKAKDEVKSLIKAKALPTVLKLVILDMWNEFKNGEYWWRFPGRMTGPAICGQYSSRAPRLMPKVKLVKDEEQQMSERVVPQPDTSIAPGSARPELIVWKSDGRYTPKSDEPYTPPQRRNQRRSFAR